VHINEYWGGTYCQLEDMFVMAAILNLVRYFKWEGSHVIYQSGLEFFREYVSEVNFVIN